MAVAADNRIGTEIAGYRIEVLIGRGGMSVVYRGHDPRLKRKVAIKLLAPELAEDVTFRERFLRESELAASLDHQNVVPIYDAGEIDGVLFIAMRYVDGTDLKALLRQEGALPPERALTLVAQVASALDAAHERGLVHRDVKPSNILCTGRAGKEHCYLADFGLSTSASDRSLTSDTQRVVGTIDYIAPEQIRDDEVDGRADVYSLTCLLYECLTGGVPFSRGSDIAAISAHLEEPPPRASAHVAELPQQLDAVLGRGMAKNPEDRWDTCLELVEAARSALGGGQISPRRWVSPPPTRVLLAGLAVAAAAAASVAAVVLTGGGASIATSDALVRIDPVGRAAVGTRAVRGQPTAVTVCAGSVWVTSAGGAVSEVDPRTLVAHTVHVHGAASDVADDGDLAAVVSGPPEQVTMVDAGTGVVGNVVKLPAGHTAGSAVAYGRDVWVANPSARAVDRIGPPYTGVGTIAAVDGSPRLVAAGEGAIWAAGGTNLWRLDPDTGRVLSRIRLPFAPKAMAAGARGIWLVDAAHDRLLRLDPTTRRLVARIPVGRGPQAVAVGNRSIWVANRGEGTVSRVDPRRNAVTGTIRVGSQPIDLVAGLGAVWVIRDTR